MILGEWWRRISLLLYRDRATAELEEEMRLHRERRAEALRAVGATDAEPTAQRRFGNRTRYQEEGRDMWGLGWIDDAVQDIRYAARRLRQRPGFTFAVVGVLALGTGATTAMFSAVDAAMLRPLPFSRPWELVTLSTVNIPFDPGPGRQFPASPTHFTDITDVTGMRGVFQHVAAWASGGLNLSDPERPIRLNVGVVSADFFLTLGVRPLIGRGFSPEEGRPGGARVAVISYGLWQRQFGGSDLVNRTITLNDKTYLVIGIAAPGFSFPKESDLWIPMAVPTTAETFEPFHGFLPSQVIARVAEGITIPAASGALLARWRQDLGPAAARTNGSYIRGMLDDLTKTGAAIPLQQSLVGERRTALIVLLGATALLLLIACANVTNLLLSQAVIRRREIAVREVLGASRGRVIRQLLTESILLTFIGAVIGIGVAPLSLGLLTALLPAELTGLAPVRLDLRVLGFAVLLGSLTGIVFGLWPALATSDAAPGETIKAGGGHGATVGGVGRLRRGLVAAELALTVVLLVGAALMLRSFARLMDLDRGMNTAHVGTLELSTSNHAAQGRRYQLIESILNRLHETPGILAAGAVNDLPLGGGGGILLDISLDSTRSSQDKDRPGAAYLIASPGYFEAMGIPLIAGRTFTPADDSGAPKVAVIGRSMAEAYWPGTNPVGRTFSVASNPPSTVIGVVQDVREFTLDEDGGPQMYLPIYQSAPSTVAIVARGTLPPAALLGAMQAAVRAVDPSQAVYHLRMMDDVLSHSVAPRWTNTLLISLFAALALLLASFGVYAVVAYGVAQRAHEFGIRSALGATGRDLVGLVSREMIWVTGFGLLAGLGGAWALAKVADSMIYGITVHDPLTFAVVPVLLLIPVVIATLLPARRAARVDPAEVMRAD